MAVLRIIFDRQKKNKKESKAAKANEQKPDIIKLINWVLYCSDLISYGY